MDMKKTTKGASSSSSSSSFDQMFGPKGSTSASSCSTILDSIFPPPVARKTGNHSAPEFQSNIFGNDERSNRWKNENERNNHERREDSYFSSSIYYGGQQHYSPPRTDDGSTTTSPSLQPKEAEGRSDTNSSASRGNWWKGSLYY